MVILVSSLLAAPPSFVDLVKNVEARERKLRSAAVRVEFETERGQFRIGEESRDSTSGKIAFNADGAFIYEAERRRPIEADAKRRLAPGSPLGERGYTTTQLNHAFDLKRTVRLETPEDGPPKAEVCSSRFGIGDLDVFELVYRGDSSIKSASGYLKQAKWEPLIADSKGMIVCQSVPYASKTSPHLRSRYLFKVDPKRGWIVFERRQQSSDSGGPWFDNYASVWVEALEVKPGLWLPVAAENRLYLSGQLVHRSNAILKDWKLDIDIPQDSFKLAIPLGTSVLQLETGKRFEWTAEHDAGNLLETAPKPAVPKN